MRALLALALLVTLVAVASAGCGKCGGYPYCCKGKRTDKDGDGWGWEKKSSCIVRGASPRNAFLRAPLCPPFFSFFVSFLFHCFFVLLVCSSLSSVGSQAQRDKCKKGGGSPPPLPTGGGKGKCPSISTCPAGYRCGCEVVSGLGRRKQQLIKLGASTSFLASAMMETRTMSANYKYGDGKTHDSFNAGLAKQNWFLSRRCYSPWRKYDARHYKRMDVLNKNAKLDIKVCASYYTFYDRYSN